MLPALFCILETGTGKVFCTGTGKVFCTVLAKCFVLYWQGVLYWYWQSVSREARNKRLIRLAR